MARLGATPRASLGLPWRRLKKTPARPAYHKKLQTMQGIGAIFIRLPFSGAWRPFILHNEERMRATMVICPRRARYLKRTGAAWTVSCTTTGT